MVSNPSDGWHKGPFALAEDLHNAWLSKDGATTALAFKPEETAAVEAKVHPDGFTVILQTLGGEICTLHVAQTATLDDVRQSVVDKLASPLDPSQIKLILDSTMFGHADAIAISALAGQDRDLGLPRSTLRLQMVLQQPRRALDAACSYSSPFNATPGTKGAPDCQEKCPRCEGEVPFAKTQRGAQRGAQSVVAFYEWCPECGFMVWWDFGW